MKILFTGGTGFIGSVLSTRLIEDGHKVTFLITPQSKPCLIGEKGNVIEADSTTPGSWQEYVAEQDAIINLAGTSIFQRWNREVKKKIYYSRILTTRNIVNALRVRNKQRTHLFSASGIGYYGYNQDDTLDELTPPGENFLAKVALDWEAEALKARALDVRVVLCRFGIVLGRQGGALKRMVPLFKIGCGGRWGSGTQWFSWIHEKDLVNCLCFLLHHQEIEGPVNFTAPHPVQNREMADLLREVLDKKRAVPCIPGFLMKGMLGEFSDVFLKGQRVMPRVLLESGYVFEFPLLRECLENLLNT